MRCCTRLDLKRVLCGDHKTLFFFLLKFIYHHCDIHCTTIKISAPFIEPLVLQWYDMHCRTLPWRVHAGKSDCYAVWISEMMLQQTTVATAIGYFDQFMHRFPTVHDLATASIDDVLMVWQGLGYYRRAHYVHQAAQIIADRGFPTSYDAWLALPGIGPYTAGAITTMALWKPAVVVDGNIERLFSRVFGIDGPKWRSKIMDIAHQQLPTHAMARPGCYTQALMDLGATVCTPKSPKCLVCPLNKHCFALANACVDTLPPKTIKKKSVRYGLVWIMRNDTGHIMLDKNPPISLLKGLWSFPTTPWSDTMPSDPQTGHKLGSVSHVFTHFTLHLDVWCRVPCVDPTPSQEWFSMPEITALPMSRLMTKVKNMVAEQE